MNELKAKPSILLNLPSELIILVSRFTKPGTHDLLNLRNSCKTLYRIIQLDQRYYRDRYSHMFKCDGILPSNIPKDIFVETFDYQSWIRTNNFERWLCTNCYLDFGQALDYGQPGDAEYCEVRVCDRCLYGVHKCRG